MFTFDELLLFLPSIAPRLVRASAPGDTTVLSAQVASLVDCLTHPTSLVMDALPAWLPVSQLEHVLSSQISSGLQGSQQMHPTSTPSL